MEALLSAFIILITFLIGLGIGYVYGVSRNIDDE